MTELSTSLDEEPQLKVDANGFSEIDVHVQDPKPIGCRSVQRESSVYDRFMKLAGVSVEFNVGTQVFKH